MQFNKLFSNDSGGRPVVSFAANLAELSAELAQNPPLLLPKLLPILPYVIADTDDYDDISDN